MTTYSEVKNRHKFDWNYAIKHPDEFGEDELLEKAESWVTCATGNQCASIPRDGIGAPRDEILKGLGELFTVTIQEGAFDWAGKVLKRIEERTTEILIEMGER